MSGFTGSTPHVHKENDDIPAIRRQVISGNWSPINRGEYTLTDLGLRHNGNGLVWLRSGVSVHEVDHDAGFSGPEKASFEYHTSLRAEEPAPHKASSPVVQTMTKPHPWFKCVAFDGKWQYVYDDHIRFLTKKRHRVDGVRVQGYTAGGLKVEVIA